MNPSLKKISLPYGNRNLTFEIDEALLNGILVSKTFSYSPEDSEEEIVREAISRPIASPRLRDLAKNRKKIVIISSDHTRPVPSHITMPVLLEEIRMGNPNADVTILISTGYHRGSTEKELRVKFGDEIFTKEKIINHDSLDESSLKKAGVLPSGGELILNKIALEADLLVAEGFIEPHFFAGFSGGRKSVLPGVASKMTVLANHCAEFIAHQNARTGVLAGNPIHKDMLYAAEVAELAFILNVVIDADKKVIYAVAGHWEEAHKAGCTFLSELASVDAIPADVVITTNGGYPLDQNIYQSVKGMTAAEATCREGGVIIIAAECSDGHGGTAFFNTFVEAESVQQVIDEIKKRDRNETIPDQWESQILARILSKHEIIMVTDAPKKMVEDMYMHWAGTIEAALEKAKEILRNDKPEITVIPDGVSVIIKK
jgi:lactate racemase